jgi:hypothetical protein
VYACLIHDNYLFAASCIDIPRRAHRQAFRLEWVAMAKFADENAIFIEDSDHASVTA